MPKPRVSPIKGIKIDNITKEKKIKNFKPRQNQNEIEFCQTCTKDVTLCKGNCNLKKEMEKKSLL